MVSQALDASWPSTLRARVALLGCHAHGGRLGEGLRIRSSVPMHLERSGAATTACSRQAAFGVRLTAGCAEGAVSACCSLCALSHRAAPASPLFLADHLNPRQPWVSNTTTWCLTRTSTRSASRTTSVRGSTSRRARSAAGRHARPRRPPSRRARRRACCGRWCTRRRSNTTTSCARGAASPSRSSRRQASTARRHALLASRWITAAATAALSRCSSTRSGSRSTRRS